MRLWIVKTGETVEPLRPVRGDFEDWFRAGLGLGEAEAPCVRPHRDEALPALDDVDGAIVTGSPAMITDGPEWSVRTSRWVAELASRERPVLGVCYGHHVVAEALGGRAGWNPRGREMGTVRVRLEAAAADDPLFASLPSPLTVQAAHSQSVLELPPGATRLATNVHEPNQAFRVGERAWGVQFHPEFDAEIVRGYWDARRSELEAEGFDVDAGRAATHDDPAAMRILERFSALTRRASRARDREAPGARP